MNEDVPQDGLHAGADEVWRTIAHVGAGGVIAAVIALVVVWWLLRRR